MNEITSIAILGAGAMGTGIGQVCAQAGYIVKCYDSFPASLEKSQNTIQSVLEMLVGKGKITAEESTGIFDRMSWTNDLSTLKDADLIIEAVVESMEVKRELLGKLEEQVSPTTLIVSNTSSLSITRLASYLKHPGRFAGLHFFNPAPLMKLVEIIPAMQSEPGLTDTLKDFVHSINKHGVVAKDTPGFIVNRLARSYYSEAIRIYEEGLASISEIDIIMKKAGGFKMGPFELMDFIGHDVNFAVTQSIFNAFFFDPRYRPSFSQQKLVEAGWLGKKTNQGFYFYPLGENTAVEIAFELEKKVFERIITMLVNEAADAVYLGICSEEDADIAMILGANYPKGLLAWGRELGFSNIKDRMTELSSFYREDRYRPSPGLIMLS